MKTISIKLPEELVTRLQGAARKANRSQSDVIRSFLENGLEKMDAAMPGSCLEKAVDLCGVFDGSPSLAGDKKHLKGFGR